VLLEKISLVVVVVRSVYSSAYVGEQLGVAHRKELRVVVVPIASCRFDESRRTGLMSKSRVHIFACIQARKSSQLPCLKYRSWKLKIQYKKNALKHVWSENSSLLICEAFLHSTEILL